MALSQVLSLNTLRRGKRTTTSKGPEHISATARASREFHARKSSATLHNYLANVQKENRKPIVSDFLKSLGDESEIALVIREIRAAREDISSVLRPEDYDLRFIDNMDKYNEWAQRRGKTFVRLPAQLRAAITRMLAIIAVFPDRITDAARETGIEFVLLEAPKWHDHLEDFPFFLNAARELAKHRTRVDGEGSLTQDELSGVSKAAQRQGSPHAAYVAHQMRLTLPG